MGEQLPVHAEGSGGRQVYDDPDKYGNIYDHFACVCLLGERGPRVTISPVTKWNLLETAMSWNYSGPRVSVPRKNRHTIIGDDEF